MAADPELAKQLLETQPFRSGDEVTYGGQLFIVDRVRPYNGSDRHWSNPARDILTVVMDNSYKTKAPLSEVQFAQTPERLRKRGLAQLVSRYKQDKT